ncbi:MAG: TIGR03936 family radical SAM-associated protein [Chloroflexota bacterium]
MRIRVTFSKTGALRYTGHLDLHTIWERAARRAGLDLTYSQGFRPQPKIQLASALPLGFSSHCELADLWLNGEPDLESLPERLQTAMPSGIGILHVEPVDERAAPLQTRLLAAEYEATLPDDFDASSLDKRLAAVMDAASLPRERRGKTYDLRPLIESLSITPGPSPDGRGGKILMRLAAREGATGRPEEVLDALGIPPEAARVERTRLIFSPESVK